jgi:DNA-binding response OmpR family regulator
MNDSGNQKSILVVEDDPNILEALRYSLEKENYNLILANNGNLALQLARDQNPDLVLLDLMLPGIDGLKHKVTIIGQNKIVVFFL